MAHYKIKLGNINASETKQTDICAPSLTKAVIGALDKLALDKKEWYLKKYCIER